VHLHVSSLLGCVTSCGKSSVESSYGAFSVPNFVFEKALIFICMHALVILSLETQWPSGIDAWVGHAYHTDTRLAAVFMSNRLLVVCH
jgi:hypothetical protein